MGWDHRRGKSDPWRGATRDFAVDTPDRDDAAEESAQDRGGHREDRDGGVDVNAVDAIRVLTGADEPGDGRAGEKDSDEATSD